MQIFTTIPLGMKIKEFRPHGKDTLLAVLEPDNVYGRELDAVKIPEGFRRVEKNWFRAPATYNEKWISCGFSVLSSDVSGPDHRRIIVEPIPEIMGWVNIYSEHETGAIYKSPEQAALARASRCVACVKVSYRPGDGLKDTGADRATITDPTRS